MTKIIPQQERVAGTFPLAVNGAVTYFTVGNAFEDTAALLSALAGAGITVADVPLTATTGTASGRIRIPGTGAGLDIGLNGKKSTLPANTWFTPDAGVTALLGLANRPYEIEYTDQTSTAFAFTDATGVATSSTQTSNTITVAGLGTGIDVAVTITGGTYSKNGGGYVSTATTARNGDTFAVRHTASGSQGTAVNTVLTIGGVSDTFTSTTTAGPTLGADLITNGGFGSGANWTLSQVGGSQLPVISGGTLNFDGGNEGNFQKATQVLAGGSSPAGSYLLTTDFTQANGNLVCTLLGASNQDRGSQGLGITGIGQTFTIVATGEVSKIEIADPDGSGSPVVDNVKLQLLS